MTTTKYTVGELKQLLANHTPEDNPASILLAEQMIDYLDGVGKEFGYDPEDDAELDHEEYISNNAVYRVLRDLFISVRDAAPASSP